MLTGRRLSVQFVPMKRFGQGIEVDRARPHIFHRDYVALRVLADSVSSFLDRFAREMPGGTVLDLGAGDSPYAAMCEKRGIRVIRADVGATDANVLPIDPDTGRVPLPDEAVRAVLSTQVLEHVTDVPAYLNEAYRLLVPGGLLFLTTHGNFILHRHTQDLWRWTIDGLRLQLCRGGFEVESVVPRIGMLATATHERGIALGALTRRVPGTGFLRPLIYLYTNLRMLLEERLTPAAATEALPELLLATARKPGKTMS